MTVRRRDLLAGIAAAVLAPRARAAALRRFGGALDAGLLEKSPHGIATPAPRTLDPHFARTRLERELAGAMHIPLFAAAPRHLTTRAAGLLVEQAVPADREGKTWAVTLRSGLVFADGTPITAADAASSLSRALAAPVGRALAATLAEARARDDHRLEIVTRVPVRDLAPLLSGLSASIVSSKPGDSFFGPAGAGGFLPGRGKNSEVDLSANPLSPAGRAWLDRLRVVSGDSAEASAAFRRGALPVAVAGTRAAERERISGDTASTIFLLLSARLSPDLRSRAAAAPNIRMLTDVFLQGRARPAFSLLPPALLGPLAATSSVVRERPAKPPAKTRLSLFVADASSELQAVADRLVFDLLEMGITASVSWKTPDALETTVEQDRFDLVLAEWTPGDFDAGRALAGAVREPTLAPGIPNAQELLALAAIEDGDARTTAAMAAAARISAGGLLVPLVHPRRVLRATSAVEGLAIDASGRVDWCEVSLR